MEPYGLSDNASDVVHAGYDAIADEYLRRFRGVETSVELDAQLRRYLARLRSALPEGGRVVDLGCGAGVPITAALAEEFDVTGVDFSNRQLELARENVPDATFIEADITEVTFPSESVDAVTAFFSIIHVPRSQHAALYSNVAAWLKPGGLFIASLGKQGREQDWNEDWLGARMFWSYHEPEVAEAQIESAGLRIESAGLETVNGCIDGPETFYWVVASKKPIGRG